MDSELERVPKVSVGMPVYNGERWIAESIESILSQTFADFELIISDNCSTDGTVAVCERYVERDKRVVLHRNSHNVGAANNFNVVFKLARGEYFKWASSNDLCGSTFLERCVRVLDENPDVVVAFPRTQLIDEKGNVTEFREDKELQTFA